MAYSLPHTFNNGGHEVTVNHNRSIVVKKGDWISKYAIAIYGYYSKELNTKFKCVINGEYANLPNPDLIEVGQVLYHLDPLPGESRREPAIIIPVRPGRPPPPVIEPEPPELPIQARYVADFLKWVNARFIDSGWRVTSTGGVGLSLLFLTGQYTSIGVVDNNSVGRDTHWLHALCGGFAFGWPKDATFGISGGPASFPSVGWILKAPVHRWLTLDDFRFGIINVEVGANFWFAIGGGSLSLLFFGIGVPVSYAAGHLDSYFRTGDPDFLSAFLMKCAPGGVMILLGSSIGFPNVGVAARIGVMYDREYWGV